MGAFKDEEIQVNQSGHSINEFLDNYHVEGLEDESVKREYLPWPVGHIEDPNLIMIEFNHLTGVEQRRALESFHGMALLGIGCEEINGQNTFEWFAKCFRERLVIRDYNEWIFIGMILESYSEGVAGLIVPKTFNPEVAKRVAKRIFLTIFGNHAKELDTWRDIQAA